METETDVHRLAERERAKHLRWAVALLLRRLMGRRSAPSRSAMANPATVAVSAVNAAPSALKVNPRHR
jgi:hypothetical protein